MTAQKNSAASHLTQLLQEAMAPLARIFQSAPVSPYLLIESLVCLEYWFITVSEAENENIEGLCASQCTRPLSKIVCFLI